MPCEITKHLFVKFCIVLFLCCSSWKCTITPQTQRITSKLQQYNKITAGHKIKEKTCSGASCVFIFFFRDSIPSYDPDALRPVVTQQLPACLAARWLFPFRIANNLSLFPLCCQFQGWGVSILYQSCIVEPKVKAHKTSRVNCMQLVVVQGFSDRWKPPHPPHPQ